jgi:hypothetical protein
MKKRSSSANKKRLSVRLRKLRPDSLYNKRRKNGRKKKNRWRKECPSVITKRRKPQSNYNSPEPTQCFRSEKKNTARRSQMKFTRPLKISKSTNL